MEHCKLLNTCTSYLFNKKICGVGSEKMIRPKALDFDEFRKTLNLF